MNASISLEPGEARLYMNTYVANPYGFQDYNETSQLTVTIAPNPMIGEGKIMISHPGSNDWKVRVTDLNGRIIIPTITGKFETNVEIPLHLNAKGTYLVRVQVGKEVIVKKVTVL
ncbi:MAG: T9SS type A sorting domain-containing protein [Bacteroidales bacterium]|nr:T9SS type A sorting domain-containing protein [Bacteroidales bacterium]